MRFDYVKTHQRSLTLSGIIIVAGLLVCHCFEIDIDLLSEAISEIDAFYEIQLFLSDPGVFFKRLVSNTTFRELFPDLGDCYTIFLLMSWVTATILSKLLEHFGGFSDKNRSDSRLDSTASFILQYIDGLFLAYIGNAAIVTFFEKLPFIPRMLKNLYDALLMGFIGEIQPPEDIDLLARTLIVIGTFLFAFVALLTLAIAINIAIFPTALETLIVCLIMLLVDMSGLPVLVPSLITIGIRTATGFIAKSLS